MARSWEVSTVLAGGNMQIHLNIDCEFTKQEHLATMIPDILLPDIVPTPQDLTIDADFPKGDHPAGFIPDVLLP